MIARRVLLLKSISTKLATMDELTATLLLRAFGWPSYRYLEGTVEEKVLNVVDHIQEFDLKSLENIALEVDGFVIDEPDEVHSQKDDTERIQLFISHKKEIRPLASELKRHLHNFGIDSFVAHEDIGDNELWRVSLSKELSNSDGLIALVSDGYEDCAWCQQEIGWVSASKKLTMGVKFREPVPQLGFLGEQQLIKFSDWDDLARRIKDIVASDERTKKKWRKSLLEDLSISYSWDRVRQLWKIISSFNSLDKIETEILVAALKNNEYVRTSNIDYVGDGKVIADFLAKYGASN